MGLLKLAVPVFSKEGQAAGHVRGTASALSGLEHAVKDSMTAKWGSSSSSSSSEDASKSLKVHLDKVTDLEGADTVGTSDVYVTLEVEQDKFIDKSFGENKSKIVDDLSPKYDENFEWLLPELEDKVLKIKVMDDDFGADDEMGEAEIELDDLSLSATAKEVKETVDRNSGAIIYLDISWG